MGVDKVCGFTRRFCACKVRMECEGVKVRGDGGIRGRGEEKVGVLMKGSFGGLMMVAVEGVKETDDAKKC